MSFTLFSTLRLTVASGVFVLAASLQGAVGLPSFFSDGMVLQRGDGAPIWGTASVGETVTIQFRGKSYQTKANGDGRWKLEIDPRAAGGPFDLEVTGENKISLRDVYVGDVWLTSGQSNMELSMERVKERFPDEIANSENARIHYFGVKTDYDFNGPKSDVNSEGWLVAGPADIYRFGAVGYFFAKSIEECYDVPVGIINSSVGGSRLDCWLSEEALGKEYPEYLASAIRWRDADLVARTEKENAEIYSKWDEQAQATDAGINGASPWYSPELDDEDWPRMTLPSFWDEGGLEPMNGVVWFRKSFEVPPQMVGKAGNLYLGTIVDADETYLNGVKVGNTTYQYPPRRYTVPSELLKAGRNQITIRAFSNSGRGSFTKDKPFHLVVDGESVDLRGEWKYQVGAKLYSRPGTIFIRWKPLGLYNAMIAPLVPYAIKGVLWYQGESNTGDAGNYKDQLVSLVADWRSKWGRKDLPFIWAQLPNFMETTPEPVESDWAKLRDMQRRALEIPDTGMSVNIDLGEWNDIHPLDKLSVADRLARVAGELAYGDKDRASTGPLVRSARLKGKKVLLDFDGIGSGLSVQGGGALNYFAIAGDDGKFVWAKAKIKGDRVVVWSAAVAKPVVVRYAWANNPDTANLYNVDGLPASPFEIEVK